MNCEPGGAELDQIEAIYRRRLPEFRRVATAITGDRDVAVDAVQEAFALAVYKRGQFRGDGSVEGWLWRIVV
ncbi:MAG: RNA polymerase sigma factor, partial [Gaiellaceae bacterium]